MKLFVTNKDEFTQKFDKLVEECPDHRLSYYNSKQIHKKAFNLLSLSIDIHGVIPLVLLPHYSEFGEGQVIFDFQTKKGDIYYYEYSTTIS